MLVEGLTKQNVERKEKKIEVYKHQDDLFLPVQRVFNQFLTAATQKHHLMQNLRSRSEFILAPKANLRGQPVKRNYRFNPLNFMQVFFFPFLSFF